MKMILQGDLIAKFVLALGLIFVVGKLGAVLLQGLLKGIGGENRRNDQDFDKLVARKRNELSLLGRTSSAPAPVPSPACAPTGTLGAYRQWFMECSKSGHPDLADSKKALELLGHLEWGDGPHYRAAQELLRRQGGPAVPTSSAHEALKRLVSKNTFLRLKRSPAPYSEMLQGVATLAGAKSLLHAQGPAQERARALAALAARALAHDGTVRDPKAMAELLFSPPPSADFDNWEEVLLRPDRSGLLDWPQLQALLDEAVSWFQALAEVPEVGREDRLGALRVLGLPEDTSWEAIKKKFKALASQRHPDRFEGSGEGPRIKERANLNFMRLQAAYEVLKKFYQE